MNPSVYIKRAEKLYDSKVQIVNGIAKLIKKYYTLQVIKTKEGNKVLKKYVDSDLEKTRVK